jgi:hypothetical protein
VFCRGNGCRRRIQRVQLDGNRVGIQQQVGTLFFGPRAPSIRE